MTKPTVGILSMQRVINYGSFLQAYALKQLLLENGAKDVYFVDIIPGRILIEESPFHNSRIKYYVGRVRDIIFNGNVITNIKTIIFTRRLTKSIKSSWNILGLERVPSRPLDLVIIGSDEVFNCCQGTQWGYTTQLFGDIPESITKEVASYAGSFGFTTLKDLSNYGIEDEIAFYLKKMKAVSVRDENSQKIINSLLKRTVPVHLDPVLAYGYQKEIESFDMSPLNKKYLVIYTYQDKNYDRNRFLEISKFAYNHNLKLVSLFARYDGCDYNVIPKNPIEVLRWFKFADYVITDTFHGTIFSIITKSKFVTFVRSYNKNKLKFLLMSLHLEQRIIEKPSELDELLRTPINFTQYDEIIAHRRKETYDYIKNLLSSSF